MTRGEAIRNYCLDCSDNNHAEVTRCPFPDCPLYPFRKRGTGSRAKAIKKYCLYCSNNQPKEVRLCPSTDCPLYPYRTGKYANYKKTDDTLPPGDGECYEYPQKTRVFRAEN